MSFYESTDQVAILRDRLKELSRIRSGFATHLGSSLYEATKDDEKLRWGRESLYDGIAMCDEERERVLKAIAEIELGIAPEPPAAPAVDAEPEAELEETVVIEQVAEAPEVEAFVEVVEVEVEPEPEMAPEVEPAIEERPFSFDFGDEPEVEAEPEPEPVFVPEPEPEPVVEASNVCPNCGSEVGPNDRFCMECGASLAQAPQSAPAPKANICPNCGSPTEPNFKFCMVCGQKL